MKRILIIGIVAQVVSALAVWPFWDSPDNSMMSYAVGGIWLLANLPGIILAIPLAIVVRARITDGR